MFCSNLFNPIHNYATHFFVYQSYGILGEKGGGGAGGGPPGGEEPYWLVLPMVIYHVVSPQHYWAKSRGRTFWIKCMEMPIHFIDNCQQWTFCPGFCPTAGTLYQPRGDCFKNAGSQCRMIFGLS